MYLATGAKKVWQSARRMSSRLEPVITLFSFGRQSQFAHYLPSRAGVEARSIGEANVFQTKCHVSADVKISHHCSIG